jgi:hypothetical protein
MSYRIEYQWGVFHVPAQQFGLVQDRYVVAIEGGDNNVYNASAWIAYILIAYCFPRRTATGFCLESANLLVYINFTAAKGHQAARFIIVPGQSICGSVSLR